MENTAEELDIQDVHPQVEDAPAAEPDKGTDTPAPEPTDKPEETPSPAPTDKAQQPNPSNHSIPKWRLDEVLEQNRQLKAQLQQPPQQQAPQQKPADAGRPKQEDFQTYEDFIRADARFEARQEYVRARQEEQQQNQQQSFNERVRKADESFSEKLAEATTKNPALLDKLRNSPALRQDLQFFGIKEADQPIALAEHLADNPALVLQLNQMPPERALRELGKIEAKLTAVTGGPQRKPSAQAPNLDPVGGGKQPAKKNPYSPDASVEDFIFGTARIPGKS